MAVKSSRFLAFTAAVFVLSACNSNPQFRMTSANRVYDSFNGLYIFLAKADLGLFESPASFPAEIDTYGEIIAGFEIGRLVQTEKKLSSALARAESRSALDSVIARCVDQVKAVAKQHKAKGIPAGSQLLDTTRKACVLAVGAVAENERSSIFVATVAGDL
ncbi:hypothetical protein QO034_13915 [Sedimentitalea sp. JM2-8]|uniref:Lipoprotein n=1 Tax=Sedimentitalea xiamensis TaxID=3050037 RepID=A0ABT7FGU4_9RHOB|nr:hypothetical protein [Sedimentitalea xiamensis]MDK3074210.1 hypothetical protein [Sedimentitalea xiamensis]